ncbi:hypothetical protein T310_7159, partial [Rasamsonia emersonii CBS 393.64]
MAARDPLRFVRPISVDDSRHPPRASRLFCSEGKTTSEQVEHSPELLALTQPSFHLSPSLTGTVLSTWLRVSRLFWCPSIVLLSGNGAEQTEKTTGIMSANELVEGEALLDEENDVEYDEETGEVNEDETGVAAGAYDDSSEEDEDLDDDEEAAREIREGFIVDEDEEELEEREQRRRERKKRRREEREREDEALDEEDLYLIGEHNPDFQPPTGTEFKRLKRGHKGDADRQASQGIDDMFKSDEEEEADYGRPSDRRRAIHDEMDDFIEEDVFSDEERARAHED